MERIWNYIHYFIYRFEVKATYLFRNILNFIFSPITKIKFLKKGLERRGSSFKQIDDIALDLSNNPLYGKSITFAAIHIGGLLILIEYGLFNILQTVLGKSLIQYVWEPSNSYKWIFIIGFLAIPWFINEQLLFKNDKYLKYFEKFDNEPKGVRRKWAGISFGIIVGIFIFFILSFIPLSKIY
ncbi:hypothetical protein CLU96_4323 [Chryseobacterium sp. 52]|uniref:hypothetical protein n=1 Tax=Chryseobacterium sp. 52 TaxID=2035213 RepID=UPI000C18DD2F|nr:hypothetical protein [Chryseobacterium sp. 52]PIF47273.1 hypothetical protein CLU96_4323 [Chryseobacterium sp. 52]